LILDLHVHSLFSGDSPVKPEEYARRMAEMRKEYDLAGFALMEHNHFITPEECDLDRLSRKYGLLIVAGVEVDTYWGHLLVYGMTKRLWERIQENGARKQEPLALSRLILEEGALAVPAHPFRGWIGMGERSRKLSGLCAVEALNGSNSEEENRSALRFAERHGLARIGGSDSHFTAELGRALTRFNSPVQSMEDVAAEIKAMRCEAITLEQAGKGPVQGGGKSSTLIK
jgi:predicted metal-dependent phosphoesterase TrpH